jgi:cytidylate kinase
MQKKITIAIDGFSSCGKSTLAKSLADALGYLFIDSGAMYRAVTLFCLQNNLFDGNEPKKEQIEEQLENISIRFIQSPNKKHADLYLNGENVEDQIRLPKVAALVSKIASMKNVRKKLVYEQQKMGETGGIVMDGRDIGSVVFPNAELKLFVTANPEIRAKRRFTELQEKNIPTTFEEVLTNLKERDEMDSNRAESPLVRTADSVLIDTTNLTPEGQLNIALELVQDRITD